MASPPDQAERDRAIRSRAQNLLVDAGAGTGKTTLIVDRLLEMIAPGDDGRAHSLDRIAAVTFTRRAAGELRFRVRQQLLRRLADTRNTEIRQGRLRAALGVLDTAFIGTIHSFSDRLLRLYPVQAKLSPSYVIEDDASETMLAAYRLLLEAAQSGTLPLHLEGTAAEDLAEEVTATVLDALAAGLRPDTQYFDTFIKAGLDLLVQRMLEQRDIAPRALAFPKFDRGAFTDAARELEAAVDQLTGQDKGERWCRRFVKKLQELEAHDDPVQLCGLLSAFYDAVESDRGIKQKDFADKAGKAFWKSFSDGEPSLAERLVNPLRRWLAIRLARVVPVAVELYEQIKNRKGVVDSIDLLLKLRDLLERDLAVRAALQRQFDHVFVDEFQDTDPLQAEILMFLCEAEPKASRWQDVVVGEGRLTIVGDPKQSIYRFRRADVALYDAVRKQVAAQPHESVRLSANFRSVEGLIGWQNRVFEHLLGASPDGNPFDAATGTVYHQPLVAGRVEKTGPSVHVVPYLHADGEPRTAQPARELEAETVAHYVKWLTNEASGTTVVDPVSGERRPARASDVVVLALVTTNVPMLLRALDRTEVPYVAFGGKLFLTDALHQQFILGLRALADRADGVAQAALLRPPFFAVDLADLVRARAEKDAETPSESTARVRAAEACITELRRRRFDRSPGETARALLEQTAFGRCVALGSNGAQRLSMLSELCLAIDNIAAAERLELDAVTARVREWVTQPIAMDPPRPLATEAIQVMTVHQAKGLEFPIVVMWDGMAPIKAPHRSAIWALDRLGEAWTIQIAGLKWEEPANAKLIDRELSFVDAERRRLIYVAATRARDLLVLPRPKVKKPDLYVLETLIRAGNEADPSVRVMDAWREGVGASWSKLVAPSARTDVEARDDEGATLAAWQAAEAVSRRALFRPLGVSAAAHGERSAAAAPPPQPEVVPEEGAIEPAPPKIRKGRFGPVFGETVHRAIAWAVRKGIAPLAAVRRAAQTTELEELRWADAAQDVERAIAVLHREGLVGSDKLSVRFEYPLAVAAKVDQDGVLLAGYIDFVAAKGELSDRELTVLDFKTDPAPDAAVQVAYPAYVEQVRTYGRLVACGSRVRAGLLFTATGEVHWC